MATTLAEIRSLIRAAVLDTDSENLMYGNDALNGQIAFQMVALRVEQPNGPYVLADASNFTSVLTPLQSLRLALPIALRLVSGTPNEFSHRSPVLTVSRKGGQRELAESIEALIDEVEGNRCPITVDNEFNAIAQYCNRFINDFNTGLSAYDGS